MSKKNRKKTVIVVVLLLILAVLFYLYFVTLKSGGGIVSARKTKVGNIEFQFSIYGPGRGDNPKFNKPMSVAVDAENNIYVTDSQNNRVCVFNSSGNFLYEYGKRGVANPVGGDKATWKPGLFNFPYGIAVEPKSGNIYVADMANRRIQIFDNKGNFVKWFPQASIQGTGHVTDLFPTAIAIRNDKLYVCNPYQIMIFDINGKFLKDIGMPGEAKGEYDRPNGIDVGKDGTIYVADSNNLRVQAIDEKGKVKWVVGEKVGGDGEMKVNPKRIFGLPRNLSVGPDGNIYVMDAFESQIVVIDPKGKIIARMGQRGVDDGKFNLPNGIAVGKDGTLYIADKENDRVQAVRLTGFAFENPGQ